MLKFATLTSTAALLAACASTPDMTYSYYPAVSQTTVTLAETVSCSTGAAPSLIVAYAAPAIATVNKADYASPPYTFSIKKMDSAFADQDLSFGVTDDGRLKSLNASWTGQGETILKSAISTATSIIPLVGVLAHGKAAPPPPECQFIADWGGKVTLNYIATLNLAADTLAPLKPVQDTSNQLAYAKLHAQLPDLAGAR